MADIYVVGIKGEVSRDKVDIATRNTGQAERYLGVIKIKVLNICDCFDRCQVKEQIYIIVLEAL